MILVRTLSIEIVFPFLHWNTIPYVCGGGEPVVAVAVVVAIVVVSASSNIHCGTLTSTRSVSLRSSVGEMVVSVEGAAVERAAIFGASVKESVLGASVNISVPGVIVVSVVIRVVGDGGIVVAAVDVDMED